MRKPTPSASGVTAAISNWFDADLDVSLSPLLTPSLRHRPPTIRLGAWVVAACPSHAAAIQPQADSPRSEPPEARLSARVELAALKAERAQYFVHGSAQHWRWSISMKRDEDPTVFERTCSARGFSPHAHPLTEAIGTSDSGSRVAHR
eukprot:scaffold20054_cov125-Isochrysis_galbana.AAC.3